MTNSSFFSLMSLKKVKLRNNHISVISFIQEISIKIALVNISPLEPSLHASPSSTQTTSNLSYCSGTVE